MNPHEMKNIGKNIFDFIYNTVSKKLSTFEG